MPDPICIQARQLYAAFQRLQHPTKVAALELHSERLRWAQSLAKHMGVALQVATIRGDVPFAVH